MWALVVSVPSLEAATKTQVRLVLPVETVRPGETFLAGLQMRMPPGWHTYWRFPGEAGKATELAWTLPAGVTAGAIQWPVPEKYEWSGLFNYVYHQEAVLLVPITVGAEVKPGPLELKAKVDWLECEEQCVPGKGEVSATLTVGNASKASADAGLIEAAKTKLPKPLPDNSATFRLDKPAGENKRTVLVSWKKTSAAASYDFFPFESESFVIEPKTEMVSGAGDAGAGQATVRKVMEAFDGKWPSMAGGLAIEKDAQGKVVSAYEIEGPITEAGKSAPTDAPSNKTSTETDTGKGASVRAPVSLVRMLGLAFLGGLILNIMPCVLPVISLKILGFVNQSKQEPGRVRMLGLIYALGVLASFLVMAGMVVGVQKAGKVASWGMQFGNPIFLVGITALVLLVALNLFGVFEVTLSSSAMGAAGTLTSKEGPSGAFFNGVLATALATPCTAPFLSVALGFAFTQPPSIVLVMFATVGLGLAAPYVALAWQPAWLKFLPKPGAWMERFKVAMGFPMLATAMWLLSIQESHFGQDGILWVGLFLVVVGMAAWIWGQFVQRGRRHQGWAMAIAVLLLGVGYWFALERQLHWRSPVVAAAGQEIRTSAAGIDWRPWSPEAVVAERAKGHPVLVDFTAKWCATCRVNKSTSIEIQAVADKLKAIGAVALLADNTLVREDIAKELLKHDRAGVPLVLVYPKDASKPPIVLPTLLTPSLVLDALDQAVK